MYAPISHEQVEEKILKNEEVRKELDTLMEGFDDESQHIREINNLRHTITLMGFEHQKQLKAWKVYYEEDLKYLRDRYATQIREIDTLTKLLKEACLLIHSHDIDDFASKELIEWNIKNWKYEK